MANVVGEPPKNQDPLLQVNQALNGYRFMARGCFWLFLDRKSVV